MKKPRLADFDPNINKNHALETIDLSDVTPIQPFSRVRQPVVPPVSQSIFEKRDTVIPRHHDTEVASHHNTMKPSYHDTVHQVRKAVKEIGKEAATHRFTMQEKQALAELIYRYRQQGIKTTENEIARIALNYLIEDFRQAGQASILERVLRELNA